MMAGNPSWWSMHPPNPHQPSNTLLASSSSPSLLPSQCILGSSSSSFPFNSLPDSQEYPLSWSQLLQGGLPGEEDRFSSTPNIHYEPKKFESWEYHHHHHQITNQFSSRVAIVDVKQEVPHTNNLYLHHGVGEFHQSNAWPQIMPPVSPSSCVTSLSSCSNILDFSHTKPAAVHELNQQHKDHSSECNGTVTGGMSKKARVQVSSSQPPLKVRKEKLGDRITALHQLVSPFGKTDTASVLLEAIGYIRFLQGQIEALSSPYLSTSSVKNIRNQHCVQDINGAFPEDPGQLLNDTCLKRKGAPNQLEDQRNPKDLRSRGLCLVPVTCTQQVGSDNNGADYWAPAFGGGF